MARERITTGDPTHQKPYPQAIVAHLTAAIDYHNELANPPDEGDTELVVETEGGTQDE